MSHQRVCGRSPHDENCGQCESESHQLRARTDLRLQDERGIALLLALVVMGTFSIMIASVALFMTSNERSSARDRDDARALNAAEAGLNNALAVLTQQDSTGTQPDRLDPLEHVVLDRRRFGDVLGIEDERARVDDLRDGHVAERQRDPQTRAQAGRDTVDPVDPAVAGLRLRLLRQLDDGLHDGGRQLARPGLGVRAERPVPHRQRGHLAAGRHEQHAHRLRRWEVHGDREPVRRIRDAEAASRSRPSAAAYRQNANVICSTSAQSKVYSNAYSSTPSAVTKPTADAAAVYASGNWHSPICSVGSFVFDSDTTLNASLGSVDLLQSNGRPSFDCTVWNPSGTTQIGRLAWDLTTKVHHDQRHDPHRRRPHLLRSVVSPGTRASARSTRTAS